MNLFNTQFDDDDVLNLFSCKNDPVIRRILAPNV